MALDLNALDSWVTKNTKAEENKKIKVDLDALDAWAATSAAPSVSGTASGSASAKVEPNKLKPYEMERPLSDRAQRYADETAFADMPERPQNIVPQVLGSAARGIATLGGWVADALIAPPVRIIDGRIDETSLNSPVTLAVADMNKGFKDVVDENFPLPASQLLARKRQEDATGFSETLATMDDNKLGTAYEGVYQIANALPWMRAASVANLGKVGTAALGAGALTAAQGGESAALEFDKEFEQGIIQNSDEYKVLLPTLGEQGAHDALKSMRINSAIALQGAVGAATGGLASRFGMNPVDELLAGMGSKAAVGGIPKKIAAEIAGEIPQELADQAVGDVLASATGSDRKVLEDPGKVAANAAVLAAIGGGGALSIDSGISALDQGVSLAREKLDAAASQSEIAASRKSLKDAVSEAFKVKPSVTAPEPLQSTPEEAYTTTPQPLSARERRERLAGLQVDRGTAANRVQNALAVSPALIDRVVSLPEVERNVLLSRIARGYAPVDAATPSIDYTPVESAQVVTPETIAPAKPRVHLGNFSSPVLPDNTSVKVSTPGAVIPRLTRSGASVVKRGQVNMEQAAAPLPVNMSGTTQAVRSIPATLKLKETTTDEKGKEQGIEGQQGQGQEGLLSSTAAPAVDSTIKPTAGRRVFASAGADPVSVPDLVSAVKASTKSPNTDFHSQMIERLAASPNARDVKVQIVRGDLTAPESPLRAVKEDGTPTYAGGRYHLSDNTVYLPEDVTPEVVVHEVQHAAVVRAATLVESGAIKSRSAIRAVSDLKESLSAIQQIDTSGMDSFTTERIKYAGKNVYELMAVLGSSPETVRALDKMQATVGIPVTNKRTRITTRLVNPAKPWIRTKLDEVVDAFRRLLGLTVKDRRVSEQQAEEYLHTEIKKVLLTAVVDKSSKTLESTDVSNVPFDSTSTETSAAVGRLMRNQKSIDAPSNVNPLSGESMVPMDRVGKDLRGVINSAFKAERTGTKPTFDMLQAMLGEQKALDHIALQRLIEVEKQAKATLGKRWANYNQVMVDRLEGRTTVSLPAKLEAAIASTRRFLDRTSLELIAVGAVPNRDVPKFLANIGKYTHRGYKAWDLKRGEWADLMTGPGGQGMELADEIMPQVLKDIELPEPAGIDKLATDYYSQDPLERKTARAILDKYLFEYGLMTPDSQSEMAMLAVKLKNIQKLPADDLLAYAHDFLGRLLDPKKTMNTNINQYKYREPKAFMADASALIERSRIPPWLKKWWGEYEEFDAHVINTVRATQGLLAKYKVMKAWIPELVKEGVLIKGRMQVGYTPLQSAVDTDYGPMNKYSIKDEDKALVDVLAMQGPAEAALFQAGLQGSQNLLSAAFSRASSASKVAQVLMSVDAIATNAISSIGVLTLASGSPLAILKNLPRAVSTARAEALSTLPTLLGGRHTTEVDAQLEWFITELIKRGVLADAALSQDMRNELKDMVLDEAYKYAPGAKRAVRKIVGTKNAAVDIMSRYNSFGDSAAKVVAVLSRMEYLKNIYPSTTGTKKLLDIAAEEVRDTMPSFALASPASKFISRQGVIAPFATFFSEAMFRNLKNDILLITKYAKMPGAPAKKYAAMMALGTVAKLTAVSAFAYGAKFLVGALMGAGEDDEEKQKGIEKASAIAADPAKYNAFQIVSDEWIRGDMIPLREIAPGKYTAITFNRYDALPFGQMVTAARKGDWKDVLSVLADPFASTSMTLPALSDVIGGLVAAIGGKDMAEKDAGKQQLAKGVTDFATKTFVPDVVNDFVLKPLARARKEIDFTPQEEAIDKMGLTVHVLDVNQSLAKGMKSYSDLINNRLGNLTYGTTTDSLSESMFGDSFVSDYAGLVATKKDGWEKYSRMMQAAKTLGYSTQDLFALKETQGVTGLSDLDMIGLIDGVMSLPDPTDSLVRRMEAEIIKAPERDREKIKDKYIELIQRVPELMDKQAAVLKNAGIKVYGYD